MVGSQKEHSRKPAVGRWLAVAALAGAALAPRAAHADATITGVSNPTPALMGRICILGFDFGSFQGMSIVRIGGQPVPILAWSNVAIDVLVQPIVGTFKLDAPSNVQVFRMNNANQTSNTFPITVTSQVAKPLNDIGSPSVGNDTLQDQPVISSCTLVPRAVDSRSAGAQQSTSNFVGYLLTIQGIGFGTRQGMSFIVFTLGEPESDDVLPNDSGEAGLTMQLEPERFGGVQLPVLDWTPTRICVFLTGTQFDPNDSTRPLFPTFHNDTDEGDVLTFTVRRDNGKSASCSLTLTPDFFAKQPNSGQVFP